MPMVGYDMMGSWNWLGVLLGIALVVLIVVAIAWLVRQLGAEGGRRRPERPSIAELELRYARARSIVKPTSRSAETSSRMAPEGSRPGDRLRGGISARRAVLLLGAGTGCYYSVYSR